METKTIGKFIAILRKANGMTQKELAEQLNVSDKAVSRWERDESLPDLTLIPVIAELFGVTADELLRGERKSVREQKLVRESDPGAESCPAEESAPNNCQTNYTQFSAKGEKQIAHILSDEKTKLKIRSMISIGLCIAGFIGALIANFGFYRGNIGFFISCAFYAAAVLCEICFGISAFGKVNDREFEGDAQNCCKSDSLRVITITISIAVILFGATIPLIIIWPQDANQGILLQDWAIYTLLFGGIFAAIAWLLSMLITIVAGKKGLYRLSDKKQILRSGKRKLKLKIAEIIVLVIAGTAIGQVVFNTYIPVSSLVEGTVFTDFERFKAYMEADVHDEIYRPDSEEVVSVENDGYEDNDGISSEIEWTNDNGETWETMEYIWQNTTVVEVVTDRKSISGDWEVHVLTNDDYLTGVNRKIQINLIWIIAYILEIAAGFAVYLRKRKALS